MASRVIGADLAELLACRCPVIYGMPLVARSDLWVRAAGEIYPGLVLDLKSLDLEEMADQADYEHRWLINPGTGEIAFWTADTGIDRQTPVDLDELDLVVIDPLPSWVWYQDMADFAEAITGERARRRLGRAIQGKGASAGSRTSSTRSTRTCCQCGMPSGTPGPGAGPCNGWLITRSLTTTPLTASFPGTQIPSCPEPAGAVTSAIVRGMGAGRLSAEDAAGQRPGRRVRGRG